MAKKRRRKHEHREIPDGAVGYVYFLRAPSVGMVKIGFSWWNPWARISSVRTCSPVPIEVLGMMRGTPGDESRLHLEFKAHRSHGEWFREHDALLKLAARKGAEYEAETAKRNKAALAGFSIG